MSNVVGIDLGTYSIKMAEGRGGVKEPELLQVGSVYNPTGQFLPVDESLFQKLAETIKQGMAERSLGGRPVHVVMPESLAFSSVISMPVLSDAELASSIHWEAEQHIPIDINEVNLEYEILYKPKKEEVGEKMRVLIVAARKESINRLVELFHLAGIEVVGLETVLLAVYKALWGTLGSSEGAVMVCHIGALSTDILIVDKGELMLSYTVQSGGLALTRSLEQGLGLAPQQAEEYKRAYGLDENQLEGKVKNALAGVMNIIIAEVRKAVQYYQSNHMQRPVRSILLSGGAAYLPGLTTYFAQSFSMEVGIANPLATVKLRQGMKGLPDDIAAYSAAIGLTIRDD